ncbi:inositol monophosphatase family protein [Actinokineospora fastidiosa]|uniref:Fructose 1,6-bisphosphatase n=1 Tax=Actinokineospora fastidiosa TaxID=1816 RepID=A0A918G8S0_9PSEU|nr:inositol monophosphatase family protein [Actinokineospora fastidiosa]GGS23947.1 fructose 1,6-bisphosphatase [Actinokineospora fastidiosa]
MSLIAWPVPVPDLPADVHPALADAARAASAAYGVIRRSHGRAALAEEVGMGADGTPTMRVDAVVEEAIAESAQRSGVNLLSEEIGFLDHGSALTLVVDPVDGSANAASGVPLSCFAGALVRDTLPAEALTTWLDTGRAWWARVGHPTAFRTSGRTRLAGATVNLLRPKSANRDAWLRVADRAGRLRILGTTCLEAILVAEGSVDAFADAGSDTLRIVDLAAALVTVPAAGGTVIDARGRALEFDPDLTRRWSGIAAATPALAEELAATILG